MKKSSTYYFLLLAVANLILGRGVAYYRAHVLEGYALTIGKDYPLPAITHEMLAISWWPYALAIVSAVGVALSLSGRARTQHLCHAAFGLSIVASFLMLATAVAYTLPLVPLIDRGLGR